MTTHYPVTKLHPDFSSPGAIATSWSAGRDQLEKAEVYWLTTVRPDGRPHVTPLIAVWLDGTLYFSTGPTERKAKNLAHNAHCILTTGTNSLGAGLDLVVEGDAERVRDDIVLQRISDAHLAKYGSDWRYEVRDGAFHAGETEAWVFAVAPTVVFGFGKGETFSQTRWRFQS